MENVRDRPVFHAAAAILIGDLGVFGVGDDDVLVVLAGVAT